MPLSAINRGRHSVFRLSVCVSMIICYQFLAQYLKLLVGIFTKFTALVHFWTRRNCLDFEVRRSKVKVTVRQDALFEHTDRWFAVEDRLVIRRDYRYRWIIRRILRVFSVICGWSVLRDSDVSE